jgi:nucleoid-associated protein YgaU
LARDANIKTAKEEQKKVKQMSLETIEASISVLPNPGYKATDTYNMKGLGGLFSGNYYVRKVRHILTSTTYDVTLETVSVDHVRIIEASSTPEQAQLAPPSTPESPSESSLGQRYEIQPGDTLWGIANRFYGDGSQYMRIADANSISDPDLIYAGDWITIP